MLVPGHTERSFPPRRDLPAVGDNWSARLVDEGKRALSRFLDGDHEAHAVRTAAREWCAGVLDRDRIRGSGHPLCTLGAAEPMSTIVTIGLNLAIGLALVALEVLIAH